MSLEREVERAFTDEGEKLGAMVLKFVSPGTSGVPDRIVLFPDGTHAFVELKAPGKRPRLLQQRVFARFERMGHLVYTIDSKAAAHEFWRRHRTRCAVRFRGAGEVR
ncbi:VRR-NUC domain-containing protein [Gordonibacter sp.]|uniref:VRR-NUC domain-containing protein n=1 Tax=Gordonibacter sp. TaxID=1968902 RepID=UPI002FC8D9D5